MIQYINMKHKYQPRDVPLLSWHSIESFWRAPIHSIEWNQSIFQPLYYFTQVNYLVLILTLFPHGSQVPDQFIVGIAFHLWFYFLNLGGLALKRHEVLERSTLLIVDFFDLLAQELTVVCEVKVLHFLDYSLSCFY